MSKTWFAVALALSVAGYSQVAFSQIVNSTATGGAGGKGGSATGGSATGGSSSNSNTVNSSGGTGGTAQGGSSSSQGGTASAQGGTVTGVSTGAISSTGNYQGADVTVNYIQPSAPGGIKGLAAGVDPDTNHYVNDNNVHYSGSQKIKNTPDVSVGGPASGPCNGFSGGIGVSMAGFAIGANASTVDKGCEARETARIAAMLGRMDIANAVLEHISVVEEALKAKAERETAAKQAAIAPPTAPAKATPEAQRQQPQQQQQQQQQQPQQQQPTPSEQELETARLGEQQKLAVAAIQRKVTMDKVNDTIMFTNATNQERTPQQEMAEEATKQQAELAARTEKQAQVQQTATAAAPPANGSPNQPVLQSAPNNVTALAAAAGPAGAPAQPAAPLNAASPATTSTGNAPDVQQAAATDKAQPQKPSPTVDATVSSAPVASPTAQVAAARPPLTGDQISNLLGLSSGPPAVSSASASPPAGEAGLHKVAAKASVPHSTKSGAPPEKGGNTTAAKSPPPDPTTAKTLLNFK